MTGTAFGHAQNAYRAVSKCMACLRALSHRAVMKDTHQTPAKTRISAKLREAMRIHVREGRNITTACQAAGMSRQGFHKAMQRPGVKAALEEEKALFVREVEASRAIFTAQALEYAVELMKSAKSETVRARMIELLINQGKMSLDEHRQQQPRHEAPVGYIYERPEHLPARNRHLATGGTADTKSPHLRHLRPIAAIQTSVSMLQSQPALLTFAASAKISSSRTNAPTKSL